MLMLKDVMISAVSQLSTFVKDYNIKIYKHFLFGHILLNGNAKKARPFVEK